MNTKNSLRGNENIDIWFSSLYFSLKYTNPENTVGIKDEIVKNNWSEKLLIWNRFPSNVEIPTRLTIWFIPLDIVLIISLYSHVTVPDVYTPKFNTPNITNLKYAISLIVRENESIEL